MKHIAISIFFLFQVLVSFSQNTENENSEDFEPYFSVKLAINTVDDNGDGNPFSTFNKFGDNAFSNPFALGLEYRFSRTLSVGLTGSMNKFKPNGKDIIQQNEVTQEVNFMAIDLAARLYLDDLIKSKKQDSDRWSYDEESGKYYDKKSGEYYDIKPNWYDVYVLGGVSYFNEDNNVNKSALAGVFGLGGNIWLTENLAINVEGLAKFSGNDTANHAQYLAGLQYNFGKRSNKNKTKEVEETIVEVVEETVSIDSDGDGVLDENDSCPSVKGDKANSGCPWPDTDGDGIEDRIDECPQVAGVATNSGCPEEVKEVPVKEEEAKDLNKKVMSLAKTIKFNSGNYNFTQESYTALNELLELFKQHPDIKIVIEGHTDSAGSFESNERLSRHRVNAVKNYFVAGGIPESSITKKSFGELKPIDSNLTKEGRENNRRVEIFVEY
jgi:outer membrane protein OmpA-like peptidoglycan-associated protein